MKPLKLMAATLVLTALLPGRGLSQPSFSSGSDGTDKEINITENTTLLVPANGIFNCTTITIASGTTLRFTRNALNTPVYLLATGDVNINGTINVDGQNAKVGVAGAGGPGGFDGGKPGVGGAAPGAGQGPGGGNGGTPANGDLGVAAGSYGTAASGQSKGIRTVYGNPLILPMVGGSGGGGETSDTVGFGGAGGGGAILIASNTKIQFGGGIVSSGEVKATTPLMVGAGARYVWSRPSWI